MVEGGDVAMPIGTWVCDTEWYKRIPYAPGWYERHKERNKPVETHLYRIQLVARTNVKVKGFNARTRMTLPPAAKGAYDRDTASDFSVKFIPENELNLIQRDVHRLGKLELLRLNGEDDGSSHADDNEDMESDADDDGPDNSDVEEDDNSVKEEDNEFEEGEEND